MSHHNEYSRIEGRRGPSHQRLSEFDAQMRLAVPAFGFAMALLAFSWAPALIWRLAASRLDKWRAS